jgi:hypothetical protein
VADDHINVFTPFRGVPHNHENQLTRALLVVLRTSPMAHSVWLRLIDPALQLQRLGRPEFDTQKHAIREAQEGDLEAPLISVFLAPEEPLGEELVVIDKDRGQVLDAIVDYDGELIVVVENKVAVAGAFQAINVNTSGAKVTIASGQEVVVVLWRDLIAELHALRERDLVGGAEDVVLDDFLTYVEDQFPTLGPFRTLGMCAGNPERITRRLRQVLSEVGGENASANYHGPYLPLGDATAIASRWFLRHEDPASAIELSFYPADTLTQARAFYSRPQALSGLNDLLARAGWSAWPHFHFGHFERGYCWTTVTRELDEYVELWRQQIANGVGEVPRDEWDDYWAWLESEQLATPADRGEFDACFTDTNRQKASPRPGLRVARRWPMDEAIALDGTSGGAGANGPSRLAVIVREELSAALGAFGEPPLVASS